MKLFYTLAQPFTPHEGQNMGLRRYFTDQNIPCTIGGNFASDLRERGLTDSGFDKADIVNIFSVRLDEHMLTAIKMSVDGVHIIDNTPWENRINKLFRFCNRFL